MLTVILCATAIPRDAAAQSAGHVDAAAGYAWLRDQDAEVTFSRGWFATIGGDVKGPLGIATEISTNTKSQSDSVTEFSMRILGLMAGPRVAAGSGRVRPFAQMLFGVARFTTKYEMPGNTLSDSTQDFAMQYGGGVDVYLADHLGVRFDIHRRRISSETNTPAGPQPYAWRQTQWFTGLTIR